jgi:hypothetical protein
MISKRALILHLAAVEAHQRFIISRSSKARRLTGAKICLSVPPVA